jgi:hypothetical protein
MSGRLCSPDANCFADEARLLGQISLLAPVHAGPVGTVLHKPSCHVLASAHSGVAMSPSVYAWLRTVIWPVSGFGCAAVMVMGVSEMAAVVLNTVPGASWAVDTDSGSVAYAIRERPTCHLYSRSTITMTHDSRRSEQQGAIELPCREHGIGMQLWPAERGRTGKSKAGSTSCMPTFRLQRTSGCTFRRQVMLVQP